MRSPAFIRAWSFGTGLLFGLGLVLSEMIDPARVLGFFDVAGTWDPTLGFVMAGALAVTVPGYRLVLARKGPLLDTRFHLPTRHDIDARLVGGAVLFGIGWGLAGYCPAPAMASLGLGSVKAAVFLACMIVGMLIYRAWLSPAARQRGPASGAAGGAAS
ncbi:MAG: YeeE/YedE family protein [Alphaproteobacteria bacterium]|nr:YeeE/YedE family protein [Alphaproteobacteria bacterium]